MFQVAQALMARLFLNPQPGLQFHVQTALLLEPPWTHASVTQMVPATCWHIKSINTPVGSKLRTSSGMSTSASEPGMAATS